MTRQRIEQLRRNSIGLCAYCYRPLHPGSTSLCWHHLTKRRAYYRKKLGLQPGHKSGMGRKAITRTPQPTSDLAQ